MNNVVNKVLHTHTGATGSVRLTQLANAYVVSVEPKFGEPIVNSHSDKKKAEIDYSYFVHYLSRG